MLGDWQHSMACLFILGASGLTRTNHVCFLQHHGLVGPLSPQVPSSFWCAGSAWGGLSDSGLRSLPAFSASLCPAEWQAFICALRAPLRSLPLPGVLMGNGLKSLHSSSLKALLLLQNQSIQSLIDQSTDQPSDWEKNSSLCSKVHSVWKLLNRWQIFSLFSQTEGRAPPWGCVCVWYRSVK